MIENINGALPEKVQKINIATTLYQSAINNLSTNKEKILAKTIIDTVFQKIDDYSEYNENLAIKQIDLILGRTESLFDDKLKTFSEEEKNNVKSAILESLSKFKTSISKQLFNKLQLIIKTIFGKRFEDLKKELKKFFEKQKNKDKNKNEDLKNKFSLESANKFTDKRITESFKNIKNVIVSEITKLNNKIVGTITKAFTGIKNIFKNVFNKIINGPLGKSIKNIRKSISNITGFFTKELPGKILKFLEKNIIAIAQILRKAIRTLFLPIVELFWLTIGPPIMLIATGIFLILLEIKKNIKFFKDGVNRFFEIIAEAVPIIVSTLPALVSLVKDIVKIIGNLITFLITEFWNFLRKDFWPFFKNELWPFVTYFFKWFNKEVWKPLLQPFLSWMINIFFKFVSDIVIPAVKTIFNWIKNDFMPFIIKHVFPFLAIVLSLLSEFLIAFKPWIKPFVNIIVKTLYELLSMLAPFLIHLVNLISTVLIDILTFLRDNWKYIFNDFIKPMSAFLIYFAGKSFKNFLWDKISAQFPWNVNDAKLNISVSDSLTDITSQELETIKNLNKELENAIAKGQSYLDEYKKNFEDKVNLERLRNKEIRNISAGTVQDLLLIVNQLDYTLRTLLEKILSLLESVSSFIFGLFNSKSLKIIQQSTDSIQKNVANFKLDIGSNDNNYIQNILEQQNKDIGNTNNNITFKIDGIDINKEFKSITSDIDNDIVKELKQNLDSLNKDIEKNGKEELEHYNTYKHLFTKLKDDIKNGFDLLNMSVNNLLPEKQNVNSIAIFQSNSSTNNAASMENN